MAARTAANVGRVVACKCATSVVTLQAIVAGACSMLEDRDIGHLPGVGSSCDYMMTLAATDTSVITVCKDRGKSIIRFRGSIVWGKLVTNAARADLALRSVAPVTIIMCFDADRDRVTAARRVVAMQAALCGPAVAAVVGRVIEAHIEALDESRGERLDRRIIGIHLGVADGAHRAFVVFPGDELVQMAADARLVAAELALDRLALAPMACVAGKLLVLGYLV